MRTVISLAIILAAAGIGAFLGSGMNESLNFAILFSMIAGFVCTIRAIEANKKK